jgi:uncharacterized protein DUF6221
MDDLVAFLNARLDEIEFAGWHAYNCQMFKPLPPGLSPMFGTQMSCNCAGPEWMIADVASKRFILSAHTHQKATRTWPQAPERDFGCADCHQNDDGEVWAYGWCHTVRGLALPFAKHPDYRSEWRP